MRKSVLVFAGVLIAFFGLNRAVGIVSGGLGNGSAWANGWNGVDDDSATAPDDAMVPDAMAPDISGAWSGPIEDSVSGPGTFGLEITQHSGRLTGTWTASFVSSGGGAGNFKGSVGGSGKISLKISTPTQKHHGCHANAKGTVSSNSISLTFKFAGCGPNSGSEFGSIDLSPI